MVDFLMISTRSSKRGVVEVYPKFIIKKSSDLMIRGGDFYAIWLQDQGVWSTDEQEALRVIDDELDAYAKKECGDFDSMVKVLHMWDAESGMIDKWHKYCQKQMRDSFHMLDEKLIFSNDKTLKRDYASKRLTYPLEKCDIPNYDKLMTTLYDPEERAKIEWAIGSIITGDSKSIQKFMVLYGAAGTGKSTVLNIIQKLFDGYYSVFDAKALGSANSSFALEAFKTNPLVAIQHDGDLSRIEDNTRLNSLVSHELMTVNEKFKSTYSSRFKSFLFMGTNKPVKITDAKSGLLRRLIDVTPSGRKLNISEYRKIIKAIDFELGGIACHCKEVYLSDQGKYDNYIPLSMMGASNDFYNFMEDSYFVFELNDETTLKEAWERYKRYCDDARVIYPLSQRAFKEELKNYFKNYEDRHTTEDGERVRSYYSVFRKDKFDQPKEKIDISTASNWIEFKKQKSIFDDIAQEYPAQYANNEKGTPLFTWKKVKTALKDIDTSKLHYVKVPENHIVIDFDIPNKDGEKDLNLNLEEANKWPKTYAELSKSGKGIHLHYIYTGDPAKLSRQYDEHIEVKVFNGDSSLRRLLTKCNDIPISEISSGLPFRKEKKVINADSVRTERKLRELIVRAMRKEIEPFHTKPCTEFIKTILDQAYDSGLKYDVSDMIGPITTFAASSTNNASYLINKVIPKMKFKSEDTSDAIDNANAPLVVFDCEVFPNLFLINWKYIGKDGVFRMINPTPEEVSTLCKNRLIGFNNLRYDNHMLYARINGYTNKMIFDLSQRIVVKKDESAKFREAKNISYTDIYEYSSNKQSLKKWEIQLGTVSHHELGLEWDKPVPEDKWEEVSLYCDDDVLATEAVWNATQGDFDAHRIQVELVRTMYGINDVSVNDTINTLSKKIIFGREKKPQSAFNYRDLSKPVSYQQHKEYREKFGKDYVFRIFNEEGLPTYKKYDGKSVLPDGYSILPFFPGYTFDLTRKPDKSFYYDEIVGEGGRVYSEPGMYVNVWDGDVSSMHPHSIIEECLFGPEYTKIFKDLVDARVAIKHRDFEAAGEMLGGVLKPFLKEETAKSLAQALKIVINSIYGLTSASFMNEFRDSRNIDNIVAKRGALFMSMLKTEVQKRGYQVCHIKTDSIKIPNADEFIKDFIIKFGREFGYEFETEADFDRFCIVNDAVYIAKDTDNLWHATGTQFQVPYVFKTLFSHEPIEFKDLSELKSVTSAIYLDFNENLPEGEHNYVFVGKNGVFTPMKPGCGAGVLLREKDGKYSSVTGTKGYLWKESEVVKSLGEEDMIDMSYYQKLVDDAIDAISQYGDFEWFVSDDSSEKFNQEKIKSDPLPDGWDEAKEEKE